MGSAGYSIFSKCEIYIVAIRNNDYNDDVNRPLVMFDRSTANIHRIISQSPLMSLTSCWLHVPQKHVTQLNITD